MNPTLAKQLVLALIRHGLAALGVYLTVHHVDATTAGAITGLFDPQALTGEVMTGVALVWSLFHKGDVHGDGSAEAIANAAAKVASVLAFGLLLGVTLTGCGSPAKTAYVSETAGYVSLKTAADGYKALVASGVPLTTAQVAQAHTLFTAAQAAEILAIDATVAAQGLATNSVGADLSTASAAEARTLADLTEFLKSIGVKL